MSVSFNRDTVFQIIQNEKMGFTFGIPERPDESSLAVVLPILRSSSLKRSYVTLPETRNWGGTNEDGVQIADTGNINRMRFTNKTDSNVFVRSGTILKGATQERTTLVSTILFPGETKELEVRCVHRSRGISHGAKVTHSGLTPLRFDQMNYRKEYSASEQQTYWRNAETVSGSVLRSTAVSFNDSEVGRRRRASSPRGQSMGAYSVLSADVNPSPIGSDFLGSMPRQDDLSSHMEEFSKSFSDMLAKVQFIPGQVGLGLISDKGVETIELFDLTDSWKALHEDAVKRVGADVVKPDTGGVFEYRKDKAVEAVKKVLGVGFSSKVIYEHRANGQPSLSVIGVSNEKYTGEIVELDGKVMHLVLLRMVNA